MSTEGAKVSDEYAGRGYDEFHVANCTYIIYGTPKNQAAGDRDMKTLSKIIVTQFNNAFSGIAAAVAEELEQSQRLMINVETLFDVLTSEASLTGRIITLNANGSEPHILKPILDAWVKVYLDLVESETQVTNSDELMVADQQL